MSTKDTVALEQELKQFREEKEQIRNLVGRIGGKHDQKRDTILNILFIAMLSAIFIADTCHHLFGMHLPFPPQFSLEIGVLLVSIKIMWMMHKQTKVEHFQFWILNSIEFRLNDISKRMRKIEQTITKED